MVSESKRRFLGLGNLMRKRPHVSFSSLTAQKLIPIRAPLSLFIRGEGRFRQTPHILAFGLWMVIAVGSHRYQTLSSSASSSNCTVQRSSIPCAQEQEAANRRCSASKTLVEISKHPLASLDCFNTSRNYSRGGNSCSISRRNQYLLWTIPGAGNTWVRQLLEQATGVATGSMYNDSSLGKIFLGEGLCDDTVLCTKAHPSTHPFELLSEQGEDFTLSTSMLSFRNSATKSASDALHRRVKFSTHCIGKGDPRESRKSIEFTRAVIIDRNPLEAAFAEVQRQTIKRQGRIESAHVSWLPKSFKWGANKRVWNRLCTDFLRHGSDYVLAWHSYVQFAQKFGMEAVYLARYEDLRQKRKREEILRDMVKFLDAELLTGSLECTFARSRDSRIRRGNDEGSKIRLRSEPEDADSSRLTLLDFLNSDFKGKPLIEWMWNIIGRVAETRGYQAPKGVKLWNYENSSGTGELEIDKVLGFSTNKWYYDDDKLAMLRTLGLDPLANRSNHKNGGRRIFSSEYSYCLEKASQVKRNGQVVITFAGNPFGVGINDGRSVFPILLNSILWMRSAGVRELLVVCFDEEYEHILRSLGISSCYLELESSSSATFSERDPKQNVVSEIYNRRLAVIEAMLRAEIDVIHTDTDAVWTRNPFAIFSAFHEGDKERREIVASRGTFPHRESVSWRGSTLCMGLISFRATPGVRQVLRAARQTSYEFHGDDQIGLNRGLARLGLVWLTKKQEVGKIVLPSRSGVSTTRVALLPDDIVRRKCTSNHGSHALIMHCFDKHFTKAPAMESMKQRGLWLLIDDWLELLISQKQANHTIEMLRIRS